MEALENIKLFQNLVYVSYAVAVIGLGLAVFFFFYFDIPNVFRLMTGRGKKEKLQKISEENFKTGNIRFNSVTGPTKRSGKLKENGHTGSIAAVHIQSESGGLTQPVAETAVLEQPAAETGVLQQPIAETAVLASPVQETAVLHKAPPIVAAPQPTAAQSNFNFNVVEQTMLIHTEEQVD